MQPAKSIAVLVVTDDLQSRWPRLRESLSDQTSAEFQTVLVDNASSGSDGEDAPDTIVLRNIRRQPLHICLNRGWSLIKNRWEGQPLAERFVFFVSADMLLAPNLFETLSGAMAADPTLVMAGADLYPSRFELVSGETPELMHGETHLGSGWVLRTARGPFPAPASPKKYFAPFPQAVMIRASALEGLGTDPFSALDPRLVWLDAMWRIRSNGGRSEPVEGASVWLQPGATLAKPGFFLYLRWVWSRRLRLPSRVTPEQRSSWFV